MPGFFGTPAVGAPSPSTGGMFGMDPLTIALGLGSIGGGIFNAILGNKQAGENAELSREQLALQRALATLNGSQSAGLNPAMERQKAALMHAMLGSARPPSIKPPSHIAPHMGEVRAAFQIPEGGFSEETLAFLSPAAMRSQEAAYQSNLKRVNPNYTAPNLVEVGYPKPISVGPGYEGGRNRPLPTDQFPRRFRV